MDICALIKKSYCSMIKPFRSRDLFLLFLILFFSYSCSRNKPDTQLEVIEFNPLSNFKFDKDTLELSFDLTDAVTNGLEIPTSRQISGGYFKTTFSVINRSDKSRKYYYKIFYQNESYKFPELQKHLTADSYDPRSGSNFYGSWVDADDSMHVTAVIPNDSKPHLVTDSFKILGNPRNESRYSGLSNVGVRLTNEIFEGTLQEMKGNPEWMAQIRKKAKKENRTVEAQLNFDAMWIINDRVKQGILNGESEVSNDEINDVIKVMKNNPEWFNSLKQKASKSNISLDDQLRKDAIWTIQKERSKRTNNRWKRNPRVGNYSFALLVCSEEQLNKIPASVKNISVSANGTFIDPYFNLFYDHSISNESGIAVIKSEKTLRTNLKYDFNTGIFVNVFKYNNYPVDTTYFNDKVGWSENNFRTAQFEQYFHNLNRHYINNSIPVVADVTGDNYSQSEYRDNAKKYSRSQFITDCIRNTTQPGKTVRVGENGKYLSFIAPGNTSNDLKKENVGLNTRIGMTYGRYLAKIKFPEIINKENVWNGLTCAYWLIYQDESEWNNRSICNAGYIPKDGGSGKSAQHIKTDFYSEIDFEILKASRYWPETSYASGETVPTDDPASNHEIMVTCTNWDMACKDPKHYDIGAKEFKAGNKNYVVHRWDDWYKALTIKTPVNHDSIFDKPYYYEIDWQPERIIWRIGEDKNNLIEVGYMDNTITQIPDNQMVMVFTNEYHDSKWWPLMPFLQELIPFPKNDIESRILELEIR
jgi:hypothetical protein